MASINDTRLCQIGGFQGHTGYLSVNDLAKTLSQANQGADLIFGILPSGAGYLLMPQEPFERLFGRCPRPWPTSRFVSLSPISFATYDDLLAKLRTLVSKSNKGAQPRDRSQANTQYTVDNALARFGEVRATFERQRVFLRLCQETLTHRLEHYALLPPPWIKSIRFVSFAFNLWLPGRRSLADRRRDPKVLDVGWTEYELPTAYDDLTVKQTVHLAMEETSMLRNPGMTRLDFKYGTTEQVPADTLPARLRSLFSSPSPSTKHEDQKDEKPQGPIVLLVHDESKMRELFETLRVDISQWQTGIKDILHPGDTGGRDNRSHNPPSSSGGWKRESRSQSPRRPYASSSSSPMPYDPRRRPPSPARPTAVSKYSVYVVDVRTMYQTLKGISSLSDTIYTNAADLNLQDEGERSSVIGWCAGNESRIIGSMWDAMACDNAIDEQRLSRWGKNATSNAQAMPYANYPVSGPSGARPQSPTTNNGEDSDVDPNDIAPPPAGPNMRPRFIASAGCPDNISSDEED